MAVRRKKAAPVEESPPPTEPKAKAKPKAKPKTVFPPQLEEDDLMKMIFYSPAGHGKTTLLGTGVGDDRISPMLLLDFEGGLKAIKTKFKRVEIADLGTIEPEMDKAHAVKVRKWDDFTEVYNFLANEEHEYKSIGIDSLSEVNYLNLMTVVDDAIELTGSTHDPDIPYRDDYMRSIAQMRKLIRFFRDLPMHVFFTCGAAEFEDAKTRKQQFRPSLTGRLVMELPGLVDTIGYLAVVEDGGESFRSLMVQPTERFMAKDRSEGGVLGDYIDDPSLSQILDALMGIAPIANSEEEAE